MSSREGSSYSARITRHSEVGRTGCGPRKVLPDEMEAAVRVRIRGGDALCKTNCDYSHQGQYGDEGARAGAH